MYNYGKYSLLLVLFVIFPSCTKKVVNKQDISDPAYFFSHSEQFEDFDLIEKRQSHYLNRKNSKTSLDQNDFSSLNFPVTLDAYKIKDLSEGLITHCEYNTHLGPKDVMAFYQQEMEYGGWEESFVSVNSQSIGIFMRPGKMCVVHSRSEKSKTFVSVWLGTVNY
ncbi:hypothetical protein Noda2021_02570 [Candidatus Dependentiae bacterium Noda2021]|nr:hypothetical protein Noda2021_02570 [Candidatus Dependentiae bacterium Noda2021]